MPRQSRHRSTTDVYHVILRGINRMDIFCDVADRQIFLHYLKSQISENFEVYGYCLMTNHIHMIVKSDTLSKSIHDLATVYAMWFNKKYKRIGSLFQDRFRSENIETENYFICCLRYILRNPVKAGICHQIASYPWSSYSAYFSLSETFVSTHFLSLFFDSHENFEAFVCQDNDEIYMDIDKPTDEEIQRLIDEKLGDKKFAELTLTEKKQLLKEIKYSVKAGLRQLARITNIPYYTIRKL